MVRPRVFNSQFVIKGESYLDYRFDAKNEQAQCAEVLLKILCHNVVVVIHEMKESEIDPGFLPDSVENASALI